MTDRVSTAEWWCCAATIKWLHGSPNEVLALVRGYPVAQMRMVQRGLDKEGLLKAV